MQTEGPCSTSDLLVASGDGTCKQDVRAGLLPTGFALRYCVVPVPTMALVHANRRSMSSDLPVASVDGTCKQDVRAGLLPTGFALRYS